MPVIDLSFEISGETLPLDHGYALFSALCRVVPELHGDVRIGVHPIRGVRTGPGVLSVSGQSRLRIRLPSEGLAPYIGLAGKAVEIEGHLLRIGVPRVESLIPAAHLAARLVTFRNALDPERFLTDVRQALAALGVAGNHGLVPSVRPGWEGQPLRRVLQIKDKRVVGYALRVTSLTAEESLSLQESGLGGRRRMGCGMFVPVGRL